jgi:circadian clock protein KaiC
MMDAGSPAPALTRVPTGIIGLDTITRGGLFQGGMYLVIGQPGTGKTILGNQLCFQHLATGGRALYVSVMAESHTRMFAHLQSQRFFDLAQVGDRLKYFSASGTVEKDGLDGMNDFLRKEMRDQRASFLVMDGMAPLGELASSPLAFERFMQRLQTTTQAHNCVTVLCTQPDAELHASAYTMVDGVVELHSTFVGSRNLREVTLPKFRGSGFMEGRHSYTITANGLVVAPQIEVVYAVPHTAAADPLAGDDALSVVDTGVNGLNTMLNGGLPTASATMVVGAPGTGKTLLGLHFLMAGAKRNERGLFFSFNELPQRLVSRAERIGLPLRDAVSRQLIEMQWQPPLDQMLDSLGEDILRRSAQGELHRLVIDSLTGLEAVSTYPERFTRFLTALVSELRAREVTTMLLVEQPEVISPSVRLPFAGHMGMFDNTLLLRHVELYSQLYRLISIINIRESGYDSSIREFQITATGIQVAKTFASAEAILTGVARPAPVTKTRQHTRRGAKERTDGNNSGS